MFAATQRPLLIPWQVVEVGGVHQGFWEVDREIRLGAQRTRLSVPDTVWRQVWADAEEAGVAL